MRQIFCYTKSLMKRTIYPIFALLLGCVFVAPYANASPDPKLQIIRYSINNTADVAEFCLTLSAPIDVSNREALIESISLEQEDKEVSINPRDLSLNPTQLCIQKLQRNRSYFISIESLPSENNLELAAPFEFKFKIPDRKPQLSFAHAQTIQGSMPTAAPAQLEAVNIKDARITIYQIANYELYAQAWKQFQQSNIAPSESLTFAREKGRVLWESDLALNDAPNQTQKVDMPSADIPNGLYFIAVTPRTAPSGIDADPKLVAGAWFTKSGFNLSSQVAPDGIFVFGNSGNAPAPGIVIQMLNKDDDVIGEGVTGTDGISRLPPASGPNASPLVIGTTKSGEVFFLPITNSSQTSLEEILPTVATDRDFYSLGDGITVTLSAKKPNGQTARIDRGTLRLLRPDQSQEAERSPRSNEIGPVTETFQLPISAPTGNWSLVWQDSDGSIIHKSDIKVQNGAVNLEIRADTEYKFLDNNSAVNLNLKLTGENAAHHVGSVNISTARPSFSAWPDYTFGLNPEDYAKTNEHFDFITSANGEATLRFPVRQTRSGAIQIKAEAKGVSSPYTTVLPFRSPQGWVGIKQIAGSYPDEIALNIITVDETLKRRSDSNVFYQIFEEGRKFEWKQAEGRWGYRPLPNHNRVKGGSLNLFANSDNTLRWRAAPGNYVVEILTSNGTVLAQYNVHHNTGTKEQDDEEILKLSAQAQSLTPNKQNSITLTLKKPAIVNVTIGDGQTKQTMNKAFPAGKNQISFVPNSSWGNKIYVRAQAVIPATGLGYKTESHYITVSLDRSELELAIQAENKPRAVTGQDFSLPITVQNIKSQQPTFISAVLTPALSSAETYAEKIPSIRLERVPVGKDGKASLVTPLPEFNGALKISISAWNDAQSGSRSIIIPATQPFVIKADIPSAMMDGEVRQASITLINKAAPEGEYRFEVKTSEGIRISNKPSGLANMGRGQSKPLSFNLSAEDALYGTCSLEITGPEHFHVSQSWPVMIQARTKQTASLGETMTIEPKQFLALKPSIQGDNNSTELKSFGFPKTVISPVPPLTLLADLRTLLEETPFTTKEVAEWIVTSKLWQKPIAASGFNIEETLNDLRAERLLKLMQRQNADGSFPKWPGKKDGDILSTAAAIVALHDETHHQLSELAAARAIAWLQRKLENTWFEETERPERAAGFLALAKVGHSDISTLSYYADTSKDKNLPPLAIAQISLAFGLNKDESAARLWLGLASNASLKQSTEDAPVTWEMLSALAANPFSDPRDIAEIVAKVPSKNLSSYPAAFLRTMWSLEQRAGTWQLAMNGTAKKQQGVRFLSKEEEASSITLQNNHDLPLFVIRQETSEPPANTAKTEQRFYRLDGTPLNGNYVERGEVYITEIIGPYILGPNPTVIQIYNGKALQPIIPSDITANALLNQYGWLGEDLTQWEGIDADNTSTGFVVPLNKNEKESSRWKVAYLVRAERTGTLTAMPVTVRKSN